MKNCIQIGQGELKVWIARPGTVYDRCRFDWTGFMPEITFRGRTVTSPEALIQGEGTGGSGLCSEFKITDMWDEEEKLFLKPGVGLLERLDLDAPYSLDIDYPLLEPFRCKMSWGEDWADFELGEIYLRGVAYRESKHIGIMGNQLAVTTKIENVGEKPLHLQEYNHNFLSLNGLGVHQGVSLSIQKNYYNKDGTVQGLIMENEKLIFTDEFQTSFMIYVRKAQPISPLRWEMRDIEAGLSVQEWGDFPVSRFLVWGQRHVIAPEIYGNFDVAPGESRAWTRLWKFFAD